MKFNLFENYTLKYPNQDPNKISAYTVLGFCIILLGLCIGIRNIAVSIFLTTFLGIVLVGILLRKNPETFHIKNPRRIWWIILAHSLAFLPAIFFAGLYWEKRNFRLCLASLICWLFGAGLLFFMYRRWQEPVLLSKETEKKPQLSVTEKFMIVNRCFSSLRDINRKHSVTTRTIRNWDAGKSRPEGYSPDFNAFELEAWCNKHVAQLRTKTAVDKPVHGMSEQDLTKDQDDDFF